MGAVKRFAVATLISTLAVLAIAVAPAHAGAATDEAKFVNHINKERSTRGMGTLTVKSDLVSVARRHSADMAAKGTIWHGSQTPYKISGWTVYGENVGMGGDEPSLHQAFMDSPSHRANILDKAFNQVGVGVVWKDGVLYVTEIFVRRASSTAPRPAYVAPKPSTTTTYRPVASTTTKAAAPKPKPVAPKPAPAAQPRTVSVLVQLVGFDAASVDPATGKALGV